MSPVIIGAILLVVCIYLVWMVWKKKTNLFHDRMELELAGRRYKMLKAFLLVAGISWAVFIVDAVVHYVLYELNEIEVPVSVYIPFVALEVFTIAAIGGLVIFLVGRRKTS